MIRQIAEDLFALASIAALVGCFYTILWIAGYSL